MTNFVILFRLNVTGGHDRIIWKTGTKSFVTFVQKAYSEKKLSASSVESPYITNGYSGKIPLTTLTSMKGLSAMQILY